MIYLETLDDAHVEQMLKDLPKTAGRAAEVALDKTAKEIKESVYGNMKGVFDSPTRYTLNSLKVTPTRNHNMEASVWFKDPDRMGQHYLVPQVEGEARKHKGFERALGDTMFVPGQGVRLNKAGNISIGQIRQILSVLGKAELTAGYNANITSRSRKRNTKERDYFFLPRKHGSLYPGVYKRKAQKGSGLGRANKYRADKSRSYQKGQTRGRYSSVIQARGIKPILIKGRQRNPYKPRLDFYGIAEKVYARRFRKLFDVELNRLLG